MQFAFTAKSMQGQTSSGMLSAESLAMARQQLRQQGLFPLSVKAAGDKPASERGSWLQTNRRGVPRKELQNFTAQLAIMTKAGIDIAGAIESLAGQCQHPWLRQTLETVHSDVVGGKSVSTALRDHRDVFDEAYIATVAAGEASGRLPDVLGRLASIQRAELRMASARRTLLAYPIILTVVSGLVVLGLMFFVLPQFADVFAQFDMPLPTITECLLVVSGELRGRWWLWCGLAVAAIAGWRLWRKSPSGRRAWDSFVLTVRPIRGVTQNLWTGRVFRLLGIMLDSGVPLVEALHLARSAVANHHFQALFDRLQNEVLNGRGLAESLGAASFIPNGVTEMIATAEKTGALAMVTQVIGEHYEEEGETRLRELASLVEPIIIVVMGVIVASIVLAVVLPMFDFASFAQRSS
jgi:type II secretory pathway component PulF